MATLLQDVSSASEWIAGALQHSGYQADFSPESLAEIDRFLDDHSSEGSALPGGLLADGLGQKLFALGAYVGETIRRERGGTWQADDDDPRGEINVELHLPEGGVVWPVQRVIKRFKNGPEDGIAVYGSLIEGQERQAG
ncbi:hypothetical protein [Streptomyces sp. NPDC047043]|uniref:hypothetical protein n=1 Tax=Streptomyces sp. NPDC047043 TaxID=3154497 RepID=UPI0033CAA908